MARTKWNLTRIRQLFAEHPNTVGESYFQHMWSAHSFALRMLMTGMFCFIHGLLPFLFKQTASQQVKILHEVMVASRHRTQQRHRSLRTESRDSKVQISQS